MKYYYHNIYISKIIIKIPHLLLYIRLYDSDFLDSQENWGKERSTTLPQIREHDALGEGMTLLPSFLIIGEAQEKGAMSRV